MVTELPFCSRASDELDVEDAAVDAAKTTRVIVTFVETSTV